MSITSFLLRIARAVVENVIRVISTQIDMIADAVTDPLRSLIQAIVAGAWRGDGANKFLDEMNNLVLPELLHIGSVCAHHRDNIAKSVDILTRAENQATNLAQQLYEPFNNIYHSAHHSQVKVATGMSKCFSSDFFGAQADNFFNNHRMAFQSVYTQLPQGSKPGKLPKAMVMSSQKVIP